MGRCGGSCDRWGEEEICDRWGDVEEVVIDGREWESGFKPAHNYLFGIFFKINKHK